MSYFYLMLAEVAAFAFLALAITKPLWEGDIKRNEAFNRHQLSRISLD